MLRMIVLFSDGTGNSASSPFKTNVFRLYDALDRTADKGQIAYYDDGVGSSQHQILAWIGGAFGFGLKRNVLDLYKFLTRHYGDAVNSLRDSATGEVPQDRKDLIPKIACFGFSRGAFTIRVLIGLINSEGLPVHAETEEELNRLAQRAYNAFRKKHFRTIFRFETPLRWLRDTFHDFIDRRNHGATYAETARDHNVKIDFLGLWDTVGAYGMPIEELRVAIDKFLFPLTFTSYDLLPSVQVTRHALSIDDERDAFTPIPFDDWDVRFKERQACIDELLARGQPMEAAELEADKCPCKRSQQIWFAGVHANVGGGYPDDGQAILPLRWIMREAQAHGVAFRPAVVDDIEKKATAFGQLYDSRAGFAALYRYKPRDLDFILNDARRRTLEDRAADGGTPPDAAHDHGIIPLIHESVIFRMASRFEGYAPIALPPRFNVVDSTGAVTTLLDFTKKAQDRVGRFANGAADPQRGKMSGLSELVERLGEPDRKVLDLVQTAVFWRRVSYQVTIWSLIALAITPLFDRAPVDDSGCAATKLFIWAVNFAAAYLPAFLAPWLDAFQQYPTWSGVFVALFGLSFWWGGRLKRIIADRSRFAWGMSKTDESGAANDLSAVQSRVGRILWDPLARVILKMKWLAWLWDGIVNNAVPGVFMLGALFVAIFAVDRVVFQARSAAGYVCEGHQDAPVLASTADFTFKTSAPCLATGFKVEKGRSYLASFKIPDGAEWKDASIEANLGGLKRDELTLRDKVAFVLAGIAMKRVFSEPWYEPILQIGNSALSIVPAESFAPFPKDSPKSEMQVRFKAPRDGELFVYVNDAYTGFFPIGWFSGRTACAQDDSIFHSYANNCGEANVTVTPLPAEFGD